MLEHFGKSVFGGLDDLVSNGRSRKVWVTAELNGVKFGSGQAFLYGKAQDVGQFTNAFTSGDFGATVDVKEQKLKLFSNKKQVEQFDYKIR